jgi:hypothetical protein
MYLTPLLKLHIDGLALIPFARWALGRFRILPWSIRGARAGNAAV